jgi:DNA processing protein
VRDAEDVLEELNLTTAVQQLEMKEILHADDTERVLLEHLSAEPTHIDNVRRQCGLPISTVSSTLAMMELKGMVRQVGGMNYVLAREARIEYEVKVE